MFKNKLIFNKYKVKSLRQITNFSWTFQGENIKDNEPVFIKIGKKDLLYNYLECEAYCLINLKGFGIPKIISYGKNGIYNILIEELLGTSLYELWELRSKEQNITHYIKLKNVCMVALQILDRLEYIHSKNYIHRDIKPNNFVTGRKDQSIIYIIDFGFSHQYRSSRTGKHIKYINRKIAMGSLRYLSVNGNKGYEQSRRDDLESLGYMLIFLATGSLPWLRIENLKINKMAKFYRAYNLKKNLSGKQLCEGLPEEFTKYINYCRKLDFEEDPNYDYLRGLFSSILDKNQEKNDLNFFWSKGEEKKSASLPNIHKRKDGSKNRLFKKIKNSLEKSENQRKTIQYNNLHLERVSNLNIKPINQKSLYSNNEININDDNLKNINEDEQIMNKNMGKIDFHTKLNLNFKKIGNNLKNKNKIQKSKPINNNNNNTKSSYNIKIKNIYNNKIYKNLIRCPHHNNKSYYSNKFHSKDNVILKQGKNETNNTINNNKFTREYFYNYYNNENTIIPKKKMNDYILFKRNSNYRTLYEREKEKSKYICTVRNNNSTNYLHGIFNTINENKINNSSANMKILNKTITNSRDKIGNISQRQNGRKNLNNNFIDNSIFRFNKNMNISDSANNIKKIKFKTNNDINSLKNYNRYNSIYSKGIPDSLFRLTEQNSDSRIKLKEKNSLYNNYVKFTLGNQKKNQLCRKYKININPSINTLNNILLTDNSISSTNSYSLLNKKIVHKEKKMNLTQKNKNIKFLKIYENNLGAIQKNISYSFILKNN